MDHGVVAGFHDPEAVLVVAAVEVLVYGLVELSPACEAFSRCVFGIQPEDYHGEVLFEVPDISILVAGSLHACQLRAGGDLPKSFGQLWLETNRVSLSIY